MTFVHNLYTASVVWVKQTTDFLLKGVSDYHIDIIELPFFCIFESDTFEIYYEIHSNKMSCYKIQS